MIPRRPPLADVALAAALGVAILVELAVAGTGRASTAGAVALGLGLAAAVAWRRAAPLLTVAGVAAVVIVWAGVQREADIPGTAIAAVMIAGYAAGAAATRRDALLGAAGIAVLAVGATGASGDPLAEYAFVLVLAGVPWLGGRLTRRHADRAVRLAELAAELERARAEHARLAVLAERARIAAELNDAVAHALAEILIQAGAAGEVLASDPERAGGVLRAIQDRGREALVELRRMLVLMRAAPAPLTTPGRPPAASRR